MSLLLNEDLAIYQLRAGYLQNIRDGVGERLITLNTNVLNGPAFRAAGWIANPADIKRTYSPPIPTAAAAEYFQAPVRATGPPAAEDKDEGGMVTGTGSNETLGPTSGANARRKRKEQLEEEDSSDLSDESEEEEDKRAAQQIKFSKMPVRKRSGSSPIRPSRLKEEVKEEDFNIMITSPSRPNDPQALRQGSMPSVEPIRGRPRRDTTTSSEMSSENEGDASMFRRQRVKRGIKSNQLFDDIIHEEDLKGADSDLEDGEVSEASDLSESYQDAAERELMMDLAEDPLTAHALKSTPPGTPPRMPGVAPLALSSPRRARMAPPELPRLPADRPLSFVQPVSLLSKAFKTSPGGSENSLQQFASLSGKADPSPLWIKIYYPFSKQPSAPLEVPTRRVTNETSNTTVAELIGLSLWRYVEEKREPPIDEKDLAANRWTLRMVEDDEVDFDFPALGRTRPISDFTSNNNRPANRRARDKPWDEFGLVKASDAQFQDNEALTPQHSVATTPAPSKQHSPDLSRAQTPLSVQRTNSSDPVAPSALPNRNPITGAFLAGAAPRKDSTVPMDLPINATQSSASRSGVPRVVNIHYMDPNSLQAHLFPIPTTSDTYIAELFTLACQKLKLDKALHVLKVRGTQTVAPQDRTVEALGDRLNLDLIRRRFVGVGDDIGGGGASPGSASPNAPLLLTTSGTPIKKSRKGFGGMLAGRAIAEGLAGGTPYHGLVGLSAGVKRYQVIRKQPLSFAPSHPRIIALDGEYVHIMPAAALDNEGMVGIGPGKATSVHLSSVVGCKVSRKHPKSIRMLVYREKETKRYDFEAQTKEEAAEICGEVRRGMDRFGGDDA